MRSLCSLGDRASGRPDSPAASLPLLPRCPLWLLCHARVPRAVVPPVSTRCARPVASRAPPRGLGDPLGGRALLSGPSSPLRVRLLLPSRGPQTPQSGALRLPFPLGLPVRPLAGPSRSDPLAAPAAERTPASRQPLPYFPSASRSDIPLPGLPICSLKTFSFLFHFVFQSAH